MKIRSFDQIVGQGSTISWIQAKLVKDNIPKVLLFVGPPGTGKTSTAKVLACELACKDRPDLLESTKDAVIDKDSSTYSVRLYNMSNLHRDLDKIREVKEDLSIGLSDTGRKVIIMDEGHGMSEEAQDTLLTQFENLDDNVYVIICSTEIAKFRQALISRCITRTFNYPSPGELRKFVTDLIDSEHLEFNFARTMAVTYILLSCQNEPRRIVNTILALDHTKVNTKEDLVDLGAAKDDSAYVPLIRYVYNEELVNGLEFIAGLQTGYSQLDVMMLIEILRVALGGKSGVVSKETASVVQNLVLTQGEDKLCILVRDIALQKEVTKNFLSGLFIKLVMKDRMIPKRVAEPLLQDVKEMHTAREEVSFATATKQMFPSIDDLFGESKVIDEGTDKEE